MNIRLHFYASSFPTNQQTKLKFDSVPISSSSMCSQIGTWMAACTRESSKQKSDTSPTNTEYLKLVSSLLLVFLLENIRLCLQEIGRL